jgi:hypothetical protein
MQKLALFCVKNANIFAKFFGKNIFKIITSVPGLVASSPHATEWTGAMGREIESRQGVVKQLDSLETYEMNQV